MIIWEYKVVGVDRYNPGDELTTHGKAGWEAYAVTAPVSSWSDYVVWMRRPHGDDRTINVTIDGQGLADAVDRAKC